MSKLYVRDIIEKLECDLLIVYFDSGIKREYSHERIKDKPFELIDCEIERIYGRQDAHCDIVVLDVNRPNPFTEFKEQLRRKYNEPTCDMIMPDIDRLEKEVLNMLWKVEEE